jgi:hypothetical protein
MHARSVGVGVRSVVMRPSASTRTTVSTAVTASTTSRVPVVCKVRFPSISSLRGPREKLLSHDSVGEAATSSAIS